MPALDLRTVDVIFGRRRRAAAALLAAGADPAAVRARTGAVVAVRDASLTVGHGEICVLMGLSGSGKSSLLRTINGLTPVSRGAVLVEHAGRTLDVARCGGGDLRRLRREAVSMVFQQFALMPWRSVRDNIALGLELGGMPRAERRRVVEEKLALVRLEDWADKLPHELSGGMQQRVGLARALATDARILLMDEPFSALDPLIRGHLQDELLALQRRLGQTILFVSHDPAEALRLGDRIAILEEGRILQVGTRAEILTRPAGETVSRLMAEVNPLAVLNGTAVMRPAADLPRDGDTVILDGAGRRCRLDPDGRPVDPPGPAADAEEPLRRLVELRHRSGGPVLLLDAGGRLAGVLGDDEIAAGLVRFTGVR